MIKVTHTTAINFDDLSLICQVFSRVRWQNLFSNLKTSFALTFINLLFSLVVANLPPYRLLVVLNSLNKTQCHNARVITANKKKNPLLKKKKSSSVVVNYNPSDINYSATRSKGSPRATSAIENILLFSRVSRAGLQKVFIIRAMGAFDVFVWVENTHIFFFLNTEIFLRKFFFFFSKKDKLYLYDQLSLTS